jgi:hypothetical protein
MSAGILPRKAIGHELAIEHGAVVEQRQAPSQAPERRMEWLAAQSST